jgi:hypothetical protein
MSYKSPLATNATPSIVTPGANLTVTGGVINVTPVALTAGDTVQIAWQSTDTALRFLSVPAQVGPVRPATPSVRCTIIQL